MSGLTGSGKGLAGYDGVSVFVSGFVAITLMALIFTSVVHYEFSYQFGNRGFSKAESCSIH